MKIVFHPLFLLVIIASFWYGLGLYMFACVLAVLIHEFSHAAAARNYGIRASRITLLPFGAAVSIDCAFLPRKYQTVILLSGAIGNITASVIAGSVIWLFPSAFNVLGMFVVANCTIAAMNLLPFYPLDGGKIAELFGNKTVVKSLLVLSNIAFTALFLAACFTMDSWSVAIFAACMIITVNLKTDNQYISKLRKFSLKTSAVREVAVRSDATLFSAFKCVSANRYTKFIVTDKNNYSFFENDLEKFLTLHSLDTKIKDII